MTDSDRDAVSETIGRGGCGDGGRPSCARRARATAKRLGRRGESLEPRHARWRSRQIVLPKETPSANDGDRPCAR